MADERAIGPAGLLMALANEHRLRILCLLGQGERSVGDLSLHLDLSQSALSQHLARLRSAGIVATRREGVTIYYRITDHEMLALAQVLSACVAKRRREN